MPSSRPEITRVWKENYEVYGADKVWLELNRQGVTVARCTTERLMRDLGLQGARRGRKVRTTMPGKDGLGLNDGQRRAPAAPHPGQPDPHEAVHGSQPGTSSRGTLKHADLVAQSQVLEFEGNA